MSDNTAMLPSVRIQRAVARTKDGIDASEDCYICQKKLGLSVFFDEPEQETWNRLSRLHETGGRI